VPKNKIIDCPFQPGNLKISEKACLNRHRMAQRKGIENCRAEDVFHYSVSQGLLKCRECPIATAIRV
jgi:hypothetical protein